MGLGDKLSEGLDKAKDAAGEHADKIADGIDKAAKVIDDKTGHEHHDKIEGAAKKAKEAVDKLDD